MERGFARLKKKKQVQRPRPQGQRVELRMWDAGTELDGTLDIFHVARGGSGPQAPRAQARGVAFLLVIT